MCEEVPDPVTVLEALKILTTPTLQSNSTTTNENLSPFEQLLESSLNKFHEEVKGQRLKKFQEFYKQQKPQHKDESGLGIRWSFTCHCLKTLEILCHSIENAMKIFHDNKKERQLTQEKDLKPSQAPPLSPDTLSVVQQKTVLTAIQFIVILGISPNLEEGVGLQANKRSGFGEAIDLQNNVDKIDYIEKSLRMIECIRVLLKCAKIESLGMLIFSRHLGDVLVALLQLVYGQKSAHKQTVMSGLSQRSKIDRNDTKSSSPTKEKVQSLELDMTKRDSSNPPEKWTPATVVDMAVSNQLDDMSNLNPESMAQEIVMKHANPSQDSVLCDLGVSGRLIDRKDLDFCEESLNDLLENISQPLLVRELLVLQGGPGKQPVQKGDGVNKLVKPVLVKAPVWLRKICGQLLTGILMKPHGVLHVLHGMLGNAVVDTGGNLITDWRKFDAVAKVIASCPKMSSTTEEYYKLVSPQVLALLHQPNKQVGRHFLRVACSTITNMASSHPQLTNKYLIRPLLQPLLSCTDVQDYNICETQQVIVDEQSLSSCIEDVHKVFVSGTEPSSTLCRYLTPVLDVLFQLYCFTKQGISHLRSACHEIIVTSLKQYSNDVSLQCLQCLVMDVSPVTMENWRYLHPNLMFAAGSDGGVVIVSKPKEGYKVSETIKREAMIELLKDLQRHGLTGDFFLFMMKELSDIIKVEIANPDIKLHDGKNVLEANEWQTERKISILNLLASLCETIGPSCLKNTQQTLDFVEVTLGRAVQIIQSCDDEATSLFENETLTMAMGLLTSVLTGGLQCNEDDRNHMKKMLPLLQSLAENHPDIEVQEMASDLRVAIATHGVVWSERLSRPAQDKEETSKDSKDRHKVKPKTETKPLIEVIDDQKETQRTKSAEDFHKEDVGRVVLSFQQALKEMCDPLLPVRGHALITFCRLIENRDKETMGKQEVVLKLFQENLDHTDSYLYLTSARGLSLLANKFPDQIIPKLASEFANFDKIERSSDLRMKLGESLLQSTRKLGDMAPKYRDILLPALLTGAKDKDPLVRASSLSNLGEVCKVLKFSLGNVIREIFECCQSLLKTDDSHEVRMAAALLTTLLLQGLGKDILKVLDSLLLDLYHLLKLTLKTEKDEKVTDHILLSLNELDKIMKDYLFPEQTLQKKIRVLDKT